MWAIQLSKLNYDDREAAAVAAAVESGWLTMGERTAEFEQRFADFLGADCHAIALSSCTAALHLSLLALDVGPGDDVVVPALTFVAAANAVRMCGARPVLADCGSLQDWNVTADTILAALTPNTKAVIVVHFAGYPCDLGPILAVCKEQGVALVEDAAHAPGALSNGQACGAIGDIGCFSFFSNKNLATGEGGMAVTRDPDLAAQLRLLRSHGMSSPTLDRHLGRASTYDVRRPGLNYRFDEIRAALGLVQLDKLREGNARRGKLTQHYRDRLRSNNISIPFENAAPNDRSVYHILPILLPKAAARLDVMAHLKNAGIQSSVHYPAFWDFSAYANQFSAEDAPIAAEICSRELTLPLWPGLTTAEVDLVCAEVRGALDASIINP